MRGAAEGWWQAQYGDVGAPSPGPLAQDSDRPRHSPHTQLLCQLSRGPHHDLKQGGDLLVVHVLLLLQLLWGQRLMHSHGHLGGPRGRRGRWGWGRGSAWHGSAVWRGRGRGARGPRWGGQEAHAGRGFGQGVDALLLQFLDFLLVLSACFRIVSQHLRVGRTAGATVRTRQDRRPGGWPHPGFSTAFTEENSKSRGPWGPYSRSLFGTKIITPHHRCTHSVTSRHGEPFQFCSKIHITCTILPF